MPNQTPRRLLNNRTRAYTDEPIKMRMRAGVEEAGGAKNEASRKAKKGKEKGKEGRSEGGNERTN